MSVVGRVYHKLANFFIKKGATDYEGGMRAAA